MVENTGKKEFKSIHPSSQFCYALTETEKG